MKKLFSIEDYGETHRIVRLFGIKITYPKREYAKLKKQSPYYYYKKNNIDITTLPPATGQVRDIQLANLAILKELHNVCAANGFDYWLFAGTALGAVRHRGFIPWDDDLDVAMPRKYFNQIIDKFNKDTKNKNLYAELYCNNSQTSFIIKIRHKYCNKIFVDIFAVDESNMMLNKTEQEKITKRIKNDREKINSTIKKGMPIQDCLSKYLKLKEKYIGQNHIENSDILLGIEWGHSEKNWFIKYDSVYPLKSVSFEGQNFFAMAKPEDYLTDYYGKYMAYPPKITFGHSMYLKLTSQEKKIIKELVKDKK